MWRSIQIMISILLLYSNIDECSRQSAVKTALGKAKNYFKSQKKEKNWHFLGHDLSEYPGKNEKYKQINIDKWEEYYSCLKIQNDNLGPHRSVIPEAIMGFEGNFLNLDCKVCLSPKEKLTIDSVTWYWAPLRSTKLSPVEYTEHILLSPEDKTLSLYNLEKSQTGQYVCKLGTSLTAPYFLTVVDASTNIKEVHTEYAKIGPYATQANCTSEHNLQFDTIWSEWSPCSSCNSVGKRHKFGYCVISLEEKCSKNKFNKEKNINENTTNKTYESSVNNKTQIKQQSKNTTSEISPVDLELFNIFQYGVPCFSHILPQSIKKLVKTQNRTNEIMTGFCNVPCPGEQIFEVRDKQGNVIERANNSAGIYSMLQDLPPLEPPVKRMLQFENSGEHITISCPGNLNSDAPIQWQLGTKKIVPELISKQSNRRIYISITDKIHMKQAKISDSNTYSCWQNNELAGTVKLLVEKKVKLTFNHHIMLLGMVFILATFLYVFTKAFFGRKHAKILK